MIERKIEMEKDKVKKFIDESLVSDYIAAGWSKVDALKENIEKLKSKSSKKSILSSKE